MLRWTIIFLLLAIIAGIFGFGIPGFALAGSAKIIFFTFVVLFVLSLVGAGFRRID